MWGVCRIGSPPQTGKQTFIASICKKVIYLNYLFLNTE